MNAKDREKPQIKKSFVWFPMAVPSEQGFNICDTFAVIGVHLRLMNPASAVAFILQFPLLTKI
jgi:hypothetical protein